MTKAPLPATPLHAEAMAGLEQAAAAPLPVAGLGIVQQGPSPLPSLYPVGTPHAYWGTSTPVTATNTNLSLLKWTSLLQTEAYQEAVDWQVVIQPLTAGDVNAGLLVIRVISSWGPINVTKYFVMPGTTNGLAGVFAGFTTTAKRFHVNSRFVSVSAAWCFRTAGTAPPTMTVNAACTVGGKRDGETDWYLPTWFAGSGAGPVSSPLSVNEWGVVYPQGGYLLGFEVDVTTMSSDALMYLLLIDQNAGQSGTTTGNVIWSSPGFSAAGNWYSLDDQRSPSLAFQSGVTWALSSTSETYSASGGSPTVNVSLKIGS